MVACHTFWMRRNYEIHDKDFVRPVDTTYIIFHKQRDHEDAASMNSSVSRREVNMREYVWNPPLINMIKFNTDDGYSKDHNRDGVVVLFEIGGVNG